LSFDEINWFGSTVGSFFIMCSRPPLLLSLE